ncbi:MAG: hypothetical protein D3925_10925 [Candidatus Electrothrix sp. AR5]|nr:hypothetical protein [Candidatus Electrothrix sp. AR5]
MTVFKGICFLTGDLKKKVCNRLCVFWVIFIIPCFCFLSGTQLNAAPSDVIGKQRVYAPIQHKKFFLGERELHGYNPDFIPNVVTFSPENAPYIRIGVQEEGYSPSNKTQKGYIQTLSKKDAKWQQIDFTGAIKKVFPNWNGMFYSGVFAEERIVFDDEGDAYMIVNCSRPPSNLGKTLLLHSSDRCKTWGVYELPKGKFKIEVNSGHHSTTRPPVILGYNNNGPMEGLFLVIPHKKNGKLFIPDPQWIAVGKHNMPAPSHSGLGNNTATKDELVHIVYLNVQTPTESKGTAQYIVTYNTKTQEVTHPILLGVNGHGPPDIHNGPAITLDSKGFLHVVLGGHQDQLYYTRSLNSNNSTQGWTKPVPIGKVKNLENLGGYTYISMCCDQEDTLHVISRYAGDKYLFCLDYLRKKNNKDWEDKGHLIIPFRTFYSCWYHKLTIDRKGRLFLYYIYYGDQYGDKNNSWFDSSGDEISAYRNKWKSPIELQEGSRKKHGFWKGVKAHDPVLLMSEDHGDHWFLLQTEDFTKGLFY